MTVSSFRLKLELSHWSPHFRINIISGYSQSARGHFLIGGIISVMSASMIYDQLAYFTQYSMYASDSETIHIWWGWICKLYISQCVCVNWPCSTTCVPRRAAAWLPPSWARWAPLRPSALGTPHPFPLEEGAEAGAPRLLATGAWVVPVHHWPGKYTHMLLTHILCCSRAKRDMRNR